MISGSLLTSATVNASNSFGERLMTCLSIAASSEPVAGTCWDLVRIREAQTWRRSILPFRTFSQGFGASLLRHCLYAVYQTAAEDDPVRGRTYLKTELAGDYWPQRQSLIALAEYLARLPMDHWRRDAEAARLLAGLLRQDSV